MNEPKLTGLIQNALLERANDDIRTMLRTRPRMDRSLMVNAALRLFEIRLEQLSELFDAAQELITVRGAKK